MGYDDTRLQVEDEGMTVAKSVRLKTVINRKGQIIGLEMMWTRRMKKECVVEVIFRKPFKRTFCEIGNFYRIKSLRNVNFFAVGLTISTLKGVSVFFKTTTTEKG